MNIYFLRNLFNDVHGRAETEDLGAYIEVVGHNLLVTLLLVASTMATLRATRTRKSTQPTTENPSLVCLRLDLAKSSDHLESVAFLVTKLDSFYGNLLRPWSGSIVLELGLARIC